MASDNQESTGFFSPSEIWRRRYKLMILVGAPIALATVLLALSLPRLYRSSATLAIEVTRLPGVGQTSTTQNQNYADQYVKDLTDVVLHDNSLLQMLSASNSLPQGTADRKEAAAALRRRINAKVASEQVLDPQTGRERTIISALQIDHDGLTPEQAQAGTQWLVDAFIQADRRTRRERAESYDRYLVGETERRKNTTAALNKQLADFKQHNIGRLPELNALNLDFRERAQRDLDAKETQLRALVNERAFVQQQMQQASAQNSGTQRLQDLEDSYRQRLQTYNPSHPDMLAMQREIEQLRAGGGQRGGTLRDQLATQRDILAQTRQRYSDSHPDVVRLQANIAALEQRLATGESPDTRVAPLSANELQLHTQTNSLDTQIASLQGGIDESRARITTVQTQLETAPQVEREYQMLNEQMTVARSTYQDILQRKIESDANQSAIGLGSSDVFRIAERPTLPDAAARSRLLALLIIGIGAAGSLALGSAIGAELLDGTVRGTRDIRQVLDVTPLGSIPEIQNQAARVLLRKQWLNLGATVGIAGLVLFFLGHLLMT